MKASRRVFPRILHIDPDVIEAFDLDALDAETKIAFGNLDHV